LPSTPGSSFTTGEGSHIIDYNGSCLPVSKYVKSYSMDFELRFSDDELFLWSNRHSYATPEENARAEEMGDKLQE
jgi:hypothetical protein